MRTCPICRFHNAETDAACFRCGASLVAETDPVAAGLVPKRAFAPARWLANLSARAGARLRWRYRRVWTWWTAPPPRDILPRKPYLAGALGLIGGLGQVYNGQPRKAFLFLVGYILAAWAVWLTFYDDHSDYVMAGAALFAVWAFHDAFKTAVRVNGRVWSFKHSFGFFMAWLFNLGALLLLSQYFLSLTVVRFKTMTQDAMKPGIRRGDRLLIDTISYRFHDPAPGDLVYYDPPQFRVEKTGGFINDLYVVDAADGFERVMAGPGQTFERRGDKYFRDGVELPPEQRPLVEGWALGDFKITAPEGHYVILITYMPMEYGWVNGVPPAIHMVTSDAKFLKACIVQRETIKGRVIAIYHPAPRRQWIGPWTDPSRPRQ